FDGYFKHLNPAWTRQLGFSQAELKAEPYLNFIHPADRDATREAIQMLGESQTLEAFEHRFRRRDGSYRWLSWKAVPEPTAGLIFAVADDVTDEKQAREDIDRYYRELQRSNTELEQFAYIASHDLQEPLRMVTSYLQLIQRRYQSQLDADADEFIGYAVDGANRMKTLINELLRFSRVSRYDLQTEAVDLEAVLSDVLNDLQMAIEETGARVTHDSLPTVLADRAQLRQVIQNLIENAIKFKAEDRPPQIRVSVDEADDQWTIAVRDNGIGIEPEFQDQLFVPFKRLHGQDVYGGTGIGLAMCQKIVERHGGRTWLISELDEGTTIYFTLPKGAHDGERDVE
ncbi:MAG: ATP-binding protein, partial [Candidatus Bipolaricaulia bacterium]